MHVDEPVVLRGQFDHGMHGTFAEFAALFEMRDASHAVGSHPQAFLDQVGAGFAKIVVMNAHFENEAFIIEAIDLVTRETGGVATIVETNWWDPLPQDVVERVFDGLVFPGWALEHAAVTETSLMLHYEPELVHMDRVVDEGNVTPKAYVRYPVRKGDVPDYGGLATPAGSSAERGKLIVDACLDAVEDICAVEFS